MILLLCDLILFTLLIIGGFTVAHTQELGINPALNLSKWYPNIENVVHPTRRLEQQHALAHVVNMEKLLSILEAPIDSEVDASMHQLSKAYHHGNICPFKRAVVSKMMNAQKIKILIVGGSVTYGADLPNRLQQRWSNSFTQMMNSGWYSGTFDVVNIGVGACNIDVWIDRVNEMKDADLIIMDLSVNDQGFDLQALPHLYRTFVQLVDALPNHPAFLFHQAFRTGAYSKEEFGHCPKPEDQGTCCGGFLYCKRWWDMQDFVAITLNRFGIPFVSYRDLAWPDYFKPPSNLNVWWNGKSHPDYKAHKMMAKLIAFGFYKLLKESHSTATHDECAPNSPISRYVSDKDIDETIQPICPQPLIRLRAGDDPQSVRSIPAYSDLGDDYLVSHPKGPWRFFNDSQLKYGWIIDITKDEISKQCANAVESWCQTAIENSVIAFKVRFGDSPRLQLTFLKSYHSGMGAISVWMDDNIQDMINVDGHWDLPYSVAHTVTISSAPLKNISTLIVGENLVVPSLSVGSHVLHMSLPPTTNKQNSFKWKLLGITSC